MGRRALVVAWVAALLVTAVGFLVVRKVAEAVRKYGLKPTVDGIVSGTLRRSGPNVAWDASSPHAEGVSEPALDSLIIAVAARSTTSFLLVRNGKLVYEWYESGASPNTPVPTASLAKATVGSMILLTLAAEGVVDMDAPAADYIPAWRNDAQKRRITLLHLASHSSGLDDVYFPPDDEVESWFASRPAWKRRYFDHPDERFHLALTAAPLLFTPGTAYRYSGVGYSALAYALASALRAHSGDDLRRYVAGSVYGPLGIPINAWGISYGDAYHQGGLTLFAIGSGGAFTPRAVARIGQSLLDRWGDAVVAPLGHEAADAPLPFTFPRDSAGTYTFVRSVPHLAWWGNDRGAWPSLPADALVGYGANDQVLLVVPSWRLVAVRLGLALTGEHRPSDPEGTLEALLFAPLARALR